MLPEINCTSSLIIDGQYTRYKNAFNKRFSRIAVKIYSEKNLTGVCNAVYFRLCIDLMYITPQFTHSLALRIITIHLCSGLRK